jgi:hypothetical protein
MTISTCLGLLVLLSGEIAGPAPESAPPAQAGSDPGRRVSPALLRALAAADPPVAALRAAASAVALTEPDRARSLVTRARLAGWLPEVRGRVDRRFARAESVDLGTSAAALAPVGIDSDNDVRYELRATWDLSKFVFNPDEIGAHFQALRTADARREIETLVIRLFFERRRLKAELSAADASGMAPSSGTPLSAVRMELRVAEIEAELDALTAGAFTRLSRARAGTGAGDDP